MNRHSTSISRRRFVSALGLAVSATGLRPLFAAAGRRPSWQRDAKTRLFTGVSADGAPLITHESGKLLTASARIPGETGPSPLRLAVEHRLRDSGAGQGEDTLEATLTVRNTTDRMLRVELEFATGARPSPDIERQSVYVPLSAAGGSGDPRFAALGVKNFLTDCNQAVGTNDFAAHYLEPMASFPAERETRALLLAPVVDVFAPQRPWRVGVFTPSDLPMPFSHSGGLWRAGRQVILVAGATLKQRCWLVLHQVGAGVGVSNGWLEYTGLTRLPGDVKARMLADIATLFEKRD